MVPVTDSCQAGLVFQGSFFLVPEFTMSWLSLGSVIFIISYCLFSVHDVFCHSGSCRC